MQNRVYALYVEVQKSIVSPSNLLRSSSNTDSVRFDVISRQKWSQIYRVTYKQRQKNLPHKESRPQSHKKPTF